MILKYSNLLNTIELINNELLLFSCWYYDYIPRYITLICVGLQLVELIRVTEYYEKLTSSEFG